MGNIIGLNYNDTQYYYIRNGQNDVIGILDSNLNQVVSYEYDSWGNTISIKDANGNTITSSSNIGIINPYRYRSYRYDTEIGLYYLNSRYYNPEWGRFINADSILIERLLGLNLYSYCYNNAVNSIDSNGNMAIPIEQAIELSSQYIQIDWYAVWTQIEYAILVAWNYLVSKIKPSVESVLLPQIEYSAAMGGCGSFTNPMPTSTPASPQPPKAPKNNKKPTDRGQVNKPVFNSNQRVVIQLAKEAKANGGITMQNARNLLQWANEYGISNHGPMIHPNRSGIWSYTEHIKIFKYHIPIFPNA